MNWKRRRGRKAYVRDTRRGGEEQVGGHVETAPCKDVLLRFKANVYGLGVGNLRDPSVIVEPRAGAEGPRRNDHGWRPKMLVSI